TGQIGDTVRINLAPLVSELQLKGVVHDLNSLYETDQQWVNNDQKQFWAGNIKTYTRQGKLWGLPVVGHPGAVQYYINRTMVAKAWPSCTSLAQPTRGRLISARRFQSCSRVRRSAWWSRPASPPRPGQIRSPSGQSHSRWKSSPIRLDRPASTPPRSPLMVRR